MIYKMKTRNQLNFQKNNMKGWIVANGDLKKVCQSLLGKDKKNVHKAKSLQSFHPG